MPYYSGFLLAVPTANRQAYKEMTEKAWPIFKDLGCLGSVETWGVDVPDGTVTSFPMATKKTDDETVVFSWLVWPDKATCDAGWQKFMDDPRAAEIGEMPFDGMRMMWGGFETLVRLGEPS